MSEIQVVHLIDDDDAVRDALTLLMAEAGLTVRSYRSALDFIAATRESRGIAPGCIVSDIRMPGMDGLELQVKLRGAGNTTPIIFITGHGDVPMAVQALRAGAMDFIEKPFEENVLLESVRRALKISERHHIKEAMHGEIEANLESLTVRERQVLEGLLVGRANKIIAFDLGMSMRTVEVHRAHIMQKMKARSLSELVRLVISVRGEPEAAP